jgi:PhnB protein
LTFLFGTPIRNITQEAGMQLNPYLTFNGECEAAFKFYERILGGKIGFMMRYQESPMAGQTPAEWQDKIMHARLAVGDKVLMGSMRRPGIPN